MRRNREAEEGLGWGVHRRVVAYGMATAGNALLQFAMLPFITRHVSVETFALYALIRVLIPACGLVANLYLGVAMVRLVHQLQDERERRRLRATFGWSRLAHTTVLSVVVFAVSWAIVSAERWEVATLAAGAFWTGSTFDAHKDLLRAVTRDGWAAAGIAVQGITQSVATLALVVVADYGLQGLLGAMLLGNVIAMGIAVPHVLRDYAARPQGAFYLRLLRLSAPLLVFGAVVYAGPLDRYVIQGLHSISGAGFYHLAAVPSFAVLLAMESLLFVLEPRVYRSATDRPNVLLRVVGYGALACLTVASGLALLAPEVLAVLGPREYAQALPVSPWMLFMAVNHAMFRFFGLGAGLATRPRAWAVAALVEVGVLAALAPAFTMAFGIVGTAGGRFASSLVGMLTCYWGAKRVWPVALPLRRLLLLVGLSLGAASLLATGTFVPIAPWTLRFGVWLGIAGLSWRLLVAGRE